MSKCIVIAGFAGIGKTTLAKKYINVCDLDSTAYNWHNTEHENFNDEQLKGLIRKPNPLWPQNYIDEIKNKMQEYDILLVKSNPDILEIYDREGIPYIICYPCKEALNEYKQRYVNRGNNAIYIEKTINSYDLKVQKWNEKPNDKIVLKLNEMLETYLLKNGYNLKEK